MYIDEFTNYLDVDLGKDAIVLLTKLGYDVQLFYAESGRALISNGFLKQAKKLAESNVSNLEVLVNKGLPLLVWNHPQS